MHHRYLFRNNPDQLLRLQPVLSEHLSEHPMLLLLLYTARLCSHFFPEHKLHRSELLLYLLPPDHLLLPVVAASVAAAVSVTAVVSVGAVVSAVLLPHPASIDAVIVVTHKIVTSFFFICLSSQNNTFI